MKDKLSIENLAESMYAATMLAGAEYFSHNTGVETIAAGTMAMYHLGYIHGLILCGYTPEETTAAFKIVREKLIKANHESQ